MKKLIFIILFFIYSSIGFACLNAYQFKIFPIGVNDGKIISMDVQISRTSQIEGNRFLKTKLKTEDEFRTMWMLQCQIAIYDKYQNLKSLKHFKTVFAFGENYNNTLFAVYRKCYKKILEDYPKIELFTPYHLSYNKLEGLTYSNKEKGDEHYINYNDIKYPLNILDNKTYYGTNSGLTYHNWFNLGTIRIFKSSNLTLIVCHLYNGDYELNHELVPFYHFSDIRACVYEEPLSHHGYGIDVFIVPPKL